VLSNLLNNAAKYTPPGGRIQLSARQEGAEAVISIRDSGMGIAADALPRVFEMYIQAARPLGRFQPGLGIGLPLARRFVEMHGGTISAHSDGLGQGSEFVIRMPMPATRDAADSANGARTAKAAAAKPTLRILVVDDDKDSTEMLASLLQLTGHTATMAHDGLEAIRQAEEFRPDVVLLDLSLPEVDGYEVARRIRQQRWGREMVLIAITGWGQDSDRHRTRQAGFDRHLVKPVDASALCQLLVALTRQKDSTA